MGKEFNFDKEYGVLLTNEGSNGDSAHHTLYLYCLLCILNRGFTSLPDFDIKSEDIKEFPPLTFFQDTGMPIRHPSRKGTFDFSRDQFTPFLAYRALLNQSKTPLSTSRMMFNSFVEGFYAKLKWNNGIFFNYNDSGGELKKWWDRDILDPATAGLKARGDGKKNWVVYLGDLHLLLSIITRFLKVKDDKSSTADENVVMHLLISNLVNQTFISKFALDFYYDHRPFGWEYAVHDYWSRNGTYIPGMIPLVIDAVKKVKGIIVV